jgi:hypothetical protein
MHVYSSRACYIPCSPHSLVLITMINVRVIISNTDGTRWERVGHGEITSTGDPVVQRRLYRQTAGRCVYRRGCGIIVSTTPASAWKHWEKSRETSTGILTRDLSNITALTFVSLFLYPPLFRQRGCKWSCLHQPGKCGRLQKCLKFRARSSAIS